ncbi:MAG: arginase family protein [Actinobacteria bacterium]|nr:arginase family protein [Actinomycetota bacterium]
MPGPAYILMAEWQGSSSSRAMQLVEGASAIREDLPSTTVEVPVPLGAGDTLGTPALRLSSVLRSRDAAAQALRALNAPHITVGGDCASTFAGLAASIARHGADRLAVLWFDAHPDLHHPATSPSGAISGMALRHALGEGVEDLAFADPVRQELLTLVGTRAFDDEEVVEVASRGIAHIAVPADPGHDALAQAVRDRLRSTGATHVYVHIDLDVLDPAEFTAVHAPEPFGLSLSQLTESVRIAVTTLPLAGATISEFAPRDAAAAAADLPSVLRVLAALTSGGRQAA